MAEEEPTTLLEYVIMGAKVRSVAFIFCFTGDGEHGNIHGLLRYLLFPPAGVQCDSLFANLDYYLFIS